MADTVTGTGTPDDPWVLRTPPGTSEYQMHRDDTADPPELVCQVGSTKLRYLARCLDDVPAMLRDHGDWMELGSADENKPAKDGTLEAWARSDANPVGGWYGLRKGYRGRFAMYVPPLLEHLGLVELEHNPRNNRIRARSGAAHVYPLATVTRVAARRPGPAYQLEPRSDTRARATVKQSLERRCPRRYGQVDA